MNRITSKNRHKIVGFVNLFFVKMIICYIESGTEAGK